MLPPVVEVGGTFGFVESAAVRSGVRKSLSGVLEMGGK